MRSLITTIFITLGLFELKSQAIYMCYGSTVTTSSSGTLYDSGGPTGYYSSYETCSVLINPPCAGNITLSFNSFYTEPGYDFLTVYDGSTTASPIIGSFAGSSIPSPVTATSGRMLIRWYSDYTATYPGWVANWTSSGGNCPPVANFSFTSNSCQGKVNFTDLSSQIPNGWLWNFGDGNASNLQSPVHTYTVPGTFSVTLVATNNYGSSSILKSLNVNPIVFTIGTDGSRMVNSPVIFTTSINSATSYIWDFGDGGLSASKTAVHTYTAMNTYTVELTVSSGSCATTNTMTVDINDEVGISESAGIRHQASIEPNPFQGSSRLMLQLYESGRTRIEVVNQLGQLIRVVDERSLSQGAYEYELNGIPAGIHYVRIIQNERSAVYKLVSLQ